MSYRIDQMLGKTRSYTTSANLRDPNRGMHRNTGPKGSTLDRAAITAQVRHLCKVNPIAAGVLNTMVDNIVGCGFVFHGEESQELQWNRFQRRIKFGRMLRQVMSELLKAGEVFIVKSLRDDLPHLEVVASERVPTDDNIEGDQVVIQGIHFDSLGRPTGYDILPFFPDDLDPVTREKMKPKTFPADQVIHLFTPATPGAVRGMSRFRPVLGLLRGSTEYIRLALQKAKWASSVIGLYHRGGEDQGGFINGPGDEVDEFGNQIAELSGGTLLKAMSPTDRIEMIPSGVQENNLKEFMMTVHRMVAVGLNQSYEKVTRDYSPHNYSSSRLGIVEDRRYYECEQQFLIDEFCYPAHAFQLEHSMRTDGIIPMDGREYDEIARENRFTAPRVEWVDPKNDLQADELAAAAGFILPDTITERQNVTFREVIKRKADLIKEHEEAEVPLPAWLKGEAGGTKLKGLDNGEEDKEKGDEEDKEKEKEKDDDAEAAA